MKRPLSVRGKSGTPGETACAGPDDDSSILYGLSLYLVSNSAKAYLAMENLRVTSPVNPVVVVRGGTQAVDEHW